MRRFAPLSLALLAGCALLLASCTPSQSMALFRGYEQREAEARRAARIILKWDKIANPVLKRRGWALRDASMIESVDTFYVFATASRVRGGQTYSQIVAYKTRDFLKMEGPLFTWTGEEQGWSGVGSPSICKLDDQYVLVFQSCGAADATAGEPSAPARIYYATSMDLENWDGPHPLAANLTRGADGQHEAASPTLATANGRLYLAWRESGKGAAAALGRGWAVATATALDAGDWRRLGTLGDLDASQHVQLLRIEDRWRMLASMPATTAAGQPTTHLQFRSMMGTGEEDADWLNWTEPRTLDLPSQPFSSATTAAMGFLADWRRKHGAFYLIYAGCGDATANGGLGDFSLGLARATDLQTWATPAGK